MLLRLPRVMLFLVLIAIGLLLTSVGEVFVKLAAWAEDVEYEIFPDEDDFA
jgi:hypothetical protein